MCAAIVEILVPNLYRILSQIIIEYARRFEVGDEEFSDPWSNFTSMLFNKLVSNEPVTLMGLTACLPSVDCRLVKRLSLARRATLTAGVLIRS
jgi:hypothetical protein